MIVTRIEQLESVIDFINDNDKLAYDLETTGLNPRKDKIMGIGLSNSDSGFYIVINNFVNGVLESVLSFADIIPVFNALLGKKLYTQNGSFDCRFTLSQSGVDLVPYIYSDSMLAKHTVNEDSFYGLKEMARDLYGDDATAEQKLMKESIKANGGTPKEFYKADLNILAEYCIKDCILTYKINEHYIEALRSEGLEQFYFETEVMPLYRNVTIPMEHYGIPVDLELLNKAKLDIRADLQSLETEIRSKIEPYCTGFNNWYLNYHYPPSRTGQFPQSLALLLNIDLPKTEGGKLSLTAKNLATLPENCTFRLFMESKQFLGADLVRKVQIAMQGSEPMLNLSSKHNLKKVFFDELKLDALSFTDKGAPQVDEKFLESIRDRFDFVPLLLEYNKLTKIEGTYIDRFIEEQESGIFYPSFQQHRTTSGRYGSNMQQLSRPLSPEDEPSELVRKHNNRIREFFTAGAGHKFLDADYESLEVVVFADDAGDEALLEMIRTKQDFYSRTAIEVYGLQNEFSADKKASNFLKAHKPELRQAAKVYALGARYGLESWKLHHTLNISQKEAQSILDRYFKNFPLLKQKMDYYEKFAKTHGYVMSKAGRKRHIPRVMELYQKYGDDLADSLELWKKYHDVPSQYSRMKFIRKEYNNLINNALNFPIQSFASSIVNQSAIAISKWLKANNIPAYICLQVHDQLVLRCRTEDAATIKPQMKWFMENTIILKAPLTADPEVADNLREGH
jgi:DNA polymerase I-like protein with 3'-5' exonuclease and polymerase domains